MARPLSDESAQQIVKKGINKLSKESVRIGQFLADVALGRELDDLLAKDGTPIMVPNKKTGEMEPAKRKAPLNVRVQAAKTFKELITDKLQPDKKDDPKKKVRDKSDLASVLERISDEVEAKKKTDANLKIQQPPERDSVASA